MNETTTKDEERADLLALSDDGHAAQRSGDTRPMTDTLPAWTVMLLYPDDGNGVSTWMDTVRAASAADAERIAQETVHKDNFGAGWDDDPEDRPDTQPADYLCLMVLAGEHSDVRVQKTYAG